MAMPIGSMIEKFRPEFEAYIEERRRALDLGTEEPVEPPLQVLQGAV
jgi:hypothetical protein